MKIFKPRSMMQEHRQHIKRASAEGGRQLDKPARNFENTLGIVAQVFNEAIYEGALVYCIGP
jgi:hypothetical protein